MKRRDLIRHLEAHGCEHLREGGDHTIYVNPTTGQSQPVPRHREVNEHTARNICIKLGVSPP